jgi:lauroyl/myristoyl acyltransferase
MTTTHDGSMTGRLAAAAYHAGAVVAALLPGPWARGIGRVSGLVCWSVQPRRRDRLAANYRQLLPAASSRELAACVRRAYADFGASVSDTLRLAHLPRARLADEVRIVGSARSRAALASGRAVVIAAHAGNWEWGGAALAAQGVPVLALARRAGSRSARFFAAVRARFGVRTAHECRPFFSGGAGVVVVFCDRGTVRDGARAPRRLARRALALAARQRCPALPAVVLREEGRYCLRLGEPLRASRRARRRQAAADRALSFLAAQLRRAPSQWFAFTPVPLPALRGSR